MLTTSEPAGVPVAELATWLPLRRWQEALRAAGTHQQREDWIVSGRDAVAAALRPGGRFVARVPNAVSPLGGHTRYGDFTHETWYTARSIRQLAAAAGLGPVQVIGCPPPVHGAASAIRATLWKPLSGLLKLALAVETGAVRGHIVTQNLTFAAARPRASGQPGTAAENAADR